MRCKFIQLILCFSLITSCGFTPVITNKDYNFIEINLKGDKKINYILRNKLSVNSNKDSASLVKLNITTNKIKSIKEKNIRNQIAKYQIKISTEVEYTSLTNGTSNDFTLYASSTYDVASRYSETLNNEKNLVNLLVNNLAEDILEKLSNQLNDL
jgi:hypothetical protein